ncbi:MAG: AAA family ATPase [Opitutales bacterium]|nr:AAA family ATPase [Opitutales bacterium]
MKYKKFVIKNYKGIQDLTIDLSKRPNCKIYTFIGLNESGKTTILEAINVVNKGFPKAEVHRLIPKQSKANFTGKVSVEAWVEVDVEDNVRIAQFLRERGFVRYKQISSFSIRTTCSFEGSKHQKNISYWGFSPEMRKKGAKKSRVFGHEEQIWQDLVTYIQENLMPRILYYENFLFSFPERIYLTGDSSEEPANVQYRDVVEDILQEIIPNGTIKTSLVDNYLSKDSASRDIFESRVEILQTRISNEVFSSWGRLFNSTSRKPSVVLRFGVEEGESVYLELRIKENSEFFYISERSLGFRWFFSFLFFTLFRKNRKTDLGETLFLLDEPASNLHSTAQQRLLETFERFVEEESKPLKLLYTTHSHHMINPKWLEGAFVVKNDAIDYSDTFDVKSVVNIQAFPYRQFVAQNPNQQDYYQPALDALDYQPGLLEKVPSVIMTEGKNDYYTLRYINEVIKGNKYEIRNLLPGSGCAKNIPVIQLYLAWNKDFLILLDSDKAGKIAKQQYVDSLGPIITSKIKTYDEFVSEIGTSSMEEIFNESERLLVTRLFNPSATKYKKSEFNTAIQEAFINKRKIEFSDETLQKFDNLLAGLSLFWAQEC